MPRGLQVIKANADQAAQRQAEYDAGGGSSQYQRALMMRNGETARVRFLEEGEGVWAVYCHDLPLKPGQQYADKILCPDQPLSDAEAMTYADGSRPCFVCNELDRAPKRTRVLINMVRHDEPKLQRDEKGAALKGPDGKPVFNGVEPALLIWETSQQVGGRLAYLESIHGPLTKHIMSIHKTGDKNNMWMVDIVEPNAPVSQLEADLNANKIDPPKAIQLASPKFKAIPLQSYGAMKHIYGGSSAAAAFAGADNGASVGNVYADAQNRVNLGAFGPAQNT